MTRPVLTDATVLVTGGAGFIGSHLTDAVVDGNEVRVLDDLSGGRREWVADGATLIEGDLLDRATVRRALDGVDVVFHLAAQVDIAASVEAPRRTHAVNATGTLSLLEHVRDGDIRVVVASSSAIYGDPAETPVAEDARTVPTSPYGVTKLAADHYARVFDGLYACEVVPLRYFNVYGPRQSAGQYSGVIDTFVRQALAGEPITVHGDGEQTRDFVHVSDVVRANLLAATTDRSGEAYNVATGESVSIRQLAELIRHVVGSDSEVVHTDPRPGDIERSVADVTRARTGLGYEPSIGLEAGIADLVEWYEHR